MHEKAELVTDYEAYQRKMDCGMQHGFDVPVEDSSSVEKYAEENFKYLESLFLRYLGRPSIFLSQ